MNPNNAIEVRNIHKNFKIFFDKGQTLKEKILFRNRRRYEVRKVLDGISFDVKKGEAIGLIGENGSGKSTTLKLLTRIMYPDEGTIEMSGRVSSLIELGAGFHPDMTGRENIYINASIFGLTKKEIDNRLDDIIAFSELEAFIDNPVRTYSSGMYMRLAFSVAINVDADILLIDEILGVGDQAFQQKCFDKLQEIKAGGTTIVIVSHALGQIEKICERCIWIHNGKIHAQGPPREVDPMYLEYMGNRREGAADKEALRREKKQREQKSDESIEDKYENRIGSGQVRISSAMFLDKDGLEKVAYRTGDAFRIKISYEVFQAMEDVTLGFEIFRVDGLLCYGSSTRTDLNRNIDLLENGEMEIYIDRLNILSGEYLIDLFIDTSLGAPVDRWSKAKVFSMFSEKQDTGISRLEHTWILKDEGGVYGTTECIGYYGSDQGKRAGREQ